MYEKLIVSLILDGVNYGGCAQGNHLLFLMERPTSVEAVWSLASFGDNLRLWGCLLSLDGAFKGPGARWTCPMTSDLQLRHRRHLTVLTFESTMTAIR
jgi:hypothetical protein